MPCFPLGGHFLLPLECGTLGASWGPSTALLGYRGRHRGPGTRSEWAKPRPGAQTAGRVPRVPRASYCAAGGRTGLSRQRPPRPSERLRTTAHCAGLSTRCVRRRAARGRVPVRAPRPRPAQLQGDLRVGGRLGTGAPALGQHRLQPVQGGEATACHACLSLLFTWVMGHDETVTGQKHPKLRAAFHLCRRPQIPPEMTGVDFQSWS